jgi:hypothetical protein
MSFGYAGNGSNEGNKNRIPKVKSLWKSITSGAALESVINVALWGLIGLVSIGLIGGLIFGRKSNTNGVIGTTSRISVKANPLVKNETSGVGDILGVTDATQPNSNYVPPNAGERSVTVENRR